MASSSRGGQVEEAGAGSGGLVGRSEGFGVLIPRPLGHLRKVAGEAQCWFCKMSFLDHVLLGSQAELPGVLQKALGVLVLSLSLLSVP